MWIYPILLVSVSGLGFFWVFLVLSLILHLKNVNVSNERDHTRL